MFSVVFMLSWFLCAKPAFAGSKGDWMKLLSDTLPVCKLSIPGTHDSGAIYGGCMLKTQDAGIFSQLELGIRAFDIRLAEKDGKRCFLTYSCIFCTHTNFRTKLLRIFI